MIGRLAQLAGILGPLALGAAALVTALAYRGAANEAYSPFNHWVSELGEGGVSDLPQVFDAGLMVGGVCFVVLMIGLGITRGGRLALLYAAIGAISGIAGILVGIYPMNFPAQHTIVAQTFFNLGWIAVLLASIDFWRRPDHRFPRWLSVLGVATVAAFIGFLAAYYGLFGDSTLAPAADRPAFTIATTLEWAVLIGIMAWAFSVGFRWWRAERAHGRA